MRPKLLIVDLDNTLCDTFHSLSKRQWEKAIKELATRGFGKEASIVKKDLGKTSFVNAMRSLNLPQQEKIKAFKSYQNVGVTGLKLFPDAKYLFSIDLPKILVTRGEPSFQAKKLKHLGIKKHFKKVYVVPSFNEKKVAFQQILKTYKLKPHDVVVIGDRMEEEIKDARALKIPSILVKRPRWPVHKGYGRPTHTVKSLKDVEKFL